MSGDKLNNEEFDPINQQVQDDKNIKISEFMTYEISN